MIGFLRLMVFWLVFAVVAYWLLLVYGRSTQREWLEKSWDGNPENEGRPETERAAFIEQGMLDYEGSLRRKLLWGVIVLPFVAIGLLLYLMNYA